jgi:uncharacterized glyoxalase superfamily protein PhnB
MAQHGTSWIINAPTLVTTKKALMADNTNFNYKIENISPILCVKDMSKSLAFYIDILGFKNAAWGDDNFTSISHGNTGLYICKGGQGNPGTWIWIGFDGDIFKLYQQLVAKGVQIKTPPKNYRWAYEFQVYDPDGHVLRLGTDPSDREPYVDE